MIVKYFVGPTFNKEKFVDILRRQMNVAAREVDDGILIDKEAFARAPAVSPWVEMNREDIMSALHTRAATEQEIFRLRHPERYELFAGGTPLTKSHDLEDLRATAVNTYGLYIVDMDTSKVMWEAYASHPIKR